MGPVNGSYNYIRSLDRRAELPREAIRTYAGDRTGVNVPLGKGVVEKGVRAPWGSNNRRREERWRGGQCGGFFGQQLIWMSYAE